MPGHPRHRRQPQPPPLQQLQAKHQCRRFASQPPGGAGKSDQHPYRRGRRLSVWPARVCLCLAMYTTHGGLLGRGGAYFYVRSRTGSPVAGGLIGRRRSAWAGTPSFFKSYTFLPRCCRVSKDCASWRFSGTSRQTSELRSKSTRVGSPAFRHRNKGAIKIVFGHAACRLLSTKIKKISCFVRGVLYSAACTSRHTRRPPRCCSRMSSH